MKKQIPSGQPVVSARMCAIVILDAIPHLMRILSEQLCSDSSPDLSMPQFRSLAFIGRNADATPADVTTFLAMPLPAG